MKYINVISRILHLPGFIRTSYLCLFFLQFYFVAPILVAQTLPSPTEPAEDKTLQIISANELEVITKGVKPARKLIGNVALKQGDVLMKCDSALFFFEENNIEAFGNIHIRQGDSVDIHSERLIYHGNLEKATLYDKVKLNDKTSDITADTLYYFVPARKAVLQNKVHLTDKKNDVYANRVDYYVNTKKAELYKNVRLTDGKVDITAQRMDYDVNLQEGTYSGGGKLVDGNTTLTSQKAHYYGLTKQTIFEENVHLVSPEYDLKTPRLVYDIKTEEAKFSGQSLITDKEGATIKTTEGIYDTKHDRLKLSQRTAVVNQSQTLIANDLDYNKISGLGKARGDVVWKDTSQNVIITSQAADFDDIRQTVLAYDRPMLIQINGNDTLFMTADTLKGFTYPAQTNENSLKDTTKSKDFYAYRNVKLFRTDMQAVCDSLMYSSADSVFRMFYNPVVWSDNHQLFADTILAFTQNNKLKKLDLIRSAFMASKEQVMVFNQIKGKNISGFFNDTTITHIYADGNAESIYYIKDEQEAYNGVNKSESRTLWIYFLKNEVDKIVFVEKPEATFFPIHEVNPADFLLKGFRWYEDRRPQRPAMLISMSK